MQRLEVVNARVDVHLTADELRAAMRNDVREGLQSEPKELPPKYFYDDRGSDLFDRITRLPEYYPTRRERSILVEHVDTIAAITGADTLIELGSGTSDKTRLLLEALDRAGTLRRFAPLDVSEGTLRDAVERLAHIYTRIEVHGVVGDFVHHLDRLPHDGARLVAFLGGTIGNLYPRARKAFLGAIAELLEPDAYFLLGTDLVKDRRRLLAAYDDAAGVTAEFNRNVLRVLNRELGAHFVPAEFEHVARWNDTDEWIEMRLRATRARRVPIAELGFDASFEVGEEMRTEISAKFTKERVARELGDAGLRIAEWWTDSDGDFALTLATRA